MTRRLGRALVGVLAAGLLLSGAPAGAADDLAVTGYALPGVPERVVERNAPALTTLTVVAASLTPDGRRVRAATADVDQQVEVAHGHGLRAELLVNNWSNALGGFDARAAHRMLSMPRRTRAVAVALADTADLQGWDGVNIDLELVRRGDAAGLVRFARLLRARLPDAATVSIDVSAQTTERGYRRHGYDLAALAGVVDVVQLMTYDQHGPGWSGPGPVGAVRWAREAAETAVAAGVPVDRLDLGVAGYGYLWDGDGGGRTVSVKQARALVREAGVDAVWRRGPREWTADLPGGRTMWWSDIRSYRARHALASDLGLHGLAVWRLGSSSPLPAP